MLSASRITTPIDLTYPSDRASPLSALPSAWLAPAKGRLRYVRSMKRQASCQVAPLGQSQAPNSDAGSRGNVDAEDTQP
jgi:hypothetical protein